MGDLVFNVHFWCPGKQSLLKQLTSLKVLIPILLSVALLAFVLSISDLPIVFGRIRSMAFHAIAICFELALAYLVLKLIQFHFFLSGLSIKVAWRKLMVAFAVGEIALTIPAGIFSQNYVLRRIQGADFSRSSAATTAILATEAGIAIITVGILGIPGWPWLRPAIVAFSITAAVFLAALTLVAPVRTLAARLVQLGPLRGIGPEFIEGVQALQCLVRPKVVLRSVVLAAAYLFALLAAFFTIAHGVGITTLTFAEATAIYLFALAITLVMPISTHLGVIEASGVGAATAFGNTATEALTMLLGFRFVWTASVWVVCGIAILLLRNEFRQSSFD